MNALPKPTQAVPASRGGVPLFLRMWLRNPLGIAAIAPSSKVLGRLMASAFDPAQPGRVLDLGSGTGVFSRALLERGFDESRLVLVERERVFARMLRRNFPRATVLRCDARDLGTALEAEGGEKLQGVTSGLPLVAMPGTVQRAILEGTFAHMLPGGIFAQFTYGPIAPVERCILRELTLKARRGHFTLLNLPPASVWWIGR